MTSPGAGLHPHPPSLPLPSTLLPLLVVLAASSLSAATSVAPTSSSTAGTFPTTPASSAALALATSSLASSSSSSTTSSTAAVNSATSVGTTREAGGLSLSSMALPTTAGLPVSPGHGHSHVGGVSDASGAVGPPQGVELPESVLSKPTKYHYYPHNQHIYLLPECAVQQVCNAVYVRLNYTQPLCACSSRHQEPCSASLNADDLHTTELSGGSSSSSGSPALTLAKTCEPVAEVRACKAPKDWSLLALQNVRTGKSHYLVTCRCSPARTFSLAGPIIHDQPTYASVPGIRVYGMVCVRRSSAGGGGGGGNRKSRPLRYRRSTSASASNASDALPPFPWERVMQLARAMNFIPDKPRRRRRRADVSDTRTQTHLR